MKNKKDILKHEKIRLNETRDFMEKTIKATEIYRTTYKENIKDAMVNLDYLDSSQSYISILVNTKFMEMADRNYDSLMRSLDKPYFARIDFKVKGTDKVENMYIGKTSLMKEDDSMPLIIDWRAPIANVYYEGRIGETSYEAEGVTHEGELLLKRQFEIDSGTMINYMDIDIATNDAFLQASLEAGADNRLKDIATSIQAEQNRVIRSDMRKPLIVQGVAGSGKTTIALHRIAYFIYTYQDVIRPDQFMIIAPNKLFLNYISEVLPELGVEKVRQTTFELFSKKCLNITFKTRPLMAKITEHLKGDAASQHELESARIKGSLVYKKALEKYLTLYASAFCDIESFAYDDLVLMHRDAISQLLLNDLVHLPLYERTKTLQKTLRSRTNKIKKDLLNETADYYDRTIEKLYDTMSPGEERRAHVVQLMADKKEKLALITRELGQLVKKYMQTFKPISLFDHYQEFLLSLKDCLDIKDEIEDEGLIDYVSSHTLLLMSQKTIEHEDYAALLYIKHKLFGVEEDLDILSVVIDEAQDFSPFQIDVLKMLCKTNMFTLLGDVSQGIHSYRGIHSWEELIGPVMSTEDTTLLTLEQSYRTTVEIMDLANLVLSHWKNPNVVYAKPVIRHGKSPEIWVHSTDLEVAECLEKSLEEVQGEGYKSIAIICKTDDECGAVYKLLNKKTRNQVTLLNGDEEVYNAGIVMLPSYLAKGLEFDVVFVLSLSEQYTASSIDVKLLYVNMTRAMHQLFVLSKKSVLPVPLNS